MPVVLGRSIRGDSNNNTLLATEEVADSLFEDLKVWVGGDPVYYAWNRAVYGKNGNDLIIRDQPGDYTESAYLNFNYQGDWTEYHLNGNVLVSGGEGNDTVSYATASYAMDIDLRPVQQQTALEPNYWNGLADVSGMAKIKGEASDIFGHDYLYSFENAVGSQYNDTMNGNNNANTLEGGDGNDVINGRGGKDFLMGGDGHDKIRGGDRGDVISGGEGNDDLYGDRGNDGITGGDGHDKIRGGDGNDIIAGGLGNDMMWGGDDNDWIWGGGGSDKAYGQGGNDTIYLQGSGGWAYGGEGLDMLHGGDGNDLLHTGNFYDAKGEEAYGGGGNDRITVGIGDDTHGGAGTDQLIVKTTARMVWDFRIHEYENGDGRTGWEHGNTGTDIGHFSGFESYKTGAGNEQILLRAGGNDKVNSGAGDDLVLTFGGNDKVLARSGNDTVETGDGNDRVFGGGGNDRVDGGDDDDYLNGGSGNDTLIGGRGDDEMIGGSGADGFVWKDGDHGLDTIKDFQIGTDYIGIQDYLQDAVPMGGSYVGKVFGLETWDGSATVLTAKTNNGWKSFARLEGLEVEEVWSAIQDGSLFGTGGGPGGPGSYVPLSDLNTSFERGDPFLELNAMQAFEVDAFSFV
ncbi:MAG: calcium-binding protein [Roseobacter sp.]